MPQKLLLLRPTLGQGGADRVTLTLLQHFDRERFQPALVLSQVVGEYLEDVPVLSLGGAAVVDSLAAAYQAASGAAAGHTIFDIRGQQCHCCFGPFAGREPEPVGSFGA